MNQPTPLINEIKDRSQRNKIKSLLHERETLGYAFSLKKLLSMLSDVTDDEDEALALLGKCIVAKTEDDEKEIKTELNKQISTIMLDNDLVSVRSDDPWGQTMDCVVYTSKSASRFTATKAIEVWPKKFGISPTKAQEMIDAATTEGKDFTAVAVRPVKTEK